MSNLQTKWRVTNQQNNVLTLEPMSSGDANTQAFQAAPGGKIELRGLKDDAAKSFTVGAEVDVTFAAAGGEQQQQTTQQSSQQGGQQKPR